jgi:hypothetical protein
VAKYRKHEPGVTWSLRGDHKDYVRTASPTQLVLYVNGATTVLDRATARLLARRINECLEATK